MLDQEDKLEISCNSFPNRIRFLLKFFKTPNQIGSVTPSSQFLTRSMMKSINWDKVDSIAELGAGNGIFTQSIYKLKRSNCRVVIFEKDDEMRNRLSHKYSEFDYSDDAQDLLNVLKELDIHEVDCIVSGLPFTLFTKPTRDTIISEVVNSLKPNGLFIAFQYSLHMQKQLKKSFSSVDIKFMPLNMPPAFVYVCRK